MSIRLSDSRKSSPGEQKLTTPVSDTARRIEAPEPPSPHSASGDLIKALEDCLDPKFEHVREAKRTTAIKLCIELDEGVCLEWLSRRHDVNAPDVFQPDAKVRLPLLNAKELAWVCKWNQERELTVPIEFALTIKDLKPENAPFEPEIVLRRIAGMLAIPGLITSLRVREEYQDPAFTTKLWGIIKTNQDLKTLDIRILGTFEGIQALAIALEFNTSLRKLILSHCKEDNFSRLCPALAKNTGIEAFALLSTACSLQDEQALCGLIRTNKLKALDLSFTQFSPSADLASATKSKRPLQRARKTLAAYFSNETKPTPPRADPVLAAIAANTSLRKLALTTTIGTQVKNELVPLLKDPRFFELAIGGIEGKHYDDITCQLEKALDQNLSLCAFDSRDPGLREYGKAHAERNRVRIRQQQTQVAKQASEAVGRLAVNANPNAPIPREVADLIAAMLSLEEQAAVGSISKP